MTRLLTWKTRQVDNISYQTWHAFITLSSDFSILPGIMQCLSTNCQTVYLHSTLRLGKNVWIYLSTALTAVVSPFLIILTYWQSSAVGLHVKNLHKILFLILFLLDCNHFVVSDWSEILHCNVCRTFFEEWKILINRLYKLRRWLLQACMNRRQMSIIASTSCSPPPLAVGHSHPPII